MDALDNGGGGGIIKGAVLFEKCAASNYNVISG